MKNAESRAEGRRTATGTLKAKSGRDATEQLTALLSQF